MLRLSIAAVLTLIAFAMIANLLLLGSLTHCHLLNDHHRKWSSLKLVVRLLFSRILVMRLYHEISYKIKMYSQSISVGQ
jgi:hypothetical protein